MAAAAVVNLGEDVTAEVTAAEEEPTVATVIILRAL